MRGGGELHDRGVNFDVRSNFDSPYVHMLICRYTDMQIYRYLRRRLVFRFAYSTIRHRGVSHNRASVKSAYLTTVPYVQRTLYAVHCPLYMDRRTLSDARPDSHPRWH